MKTTLLDPSALSVLKWIVSILETRGIVFQITGGLAAKVYGSPRPLADIDISIPEDSFAKLLPDVKQHIIFGPARFKDENWELTLMTLLVNGQEIDLGSNEALIFDKCIGSWASLVDDLSISENHEIEGIKLPIIPKSQLINYKRKLGRSCDLEDISSIANT